MAGRFLPSRKRMRKVEEKATVVLAGLTSNLAEISMTETVCVEFLRWEAALLHQPLGEVLELSPDTLALLKLASENGDAFASVLYAKTCLFSEARSCVGNTLLGNSIRKHFQDAAERFGWKDMGGVKKMVFSTASRTCCGPRIDALIEYSAASDAPPCLKTIIANKCIAVREIIDAMHLPQLCIDMALVLHEDSLRSYGTGAAFEHESGEAEEAIHRAYVPLCSPLGGGKGDAALRRLVPPELLLLIGAMLVPLGSQRHIWKTLIVTSGNAERPHLIDRICDDLVVHGRPFVLKIDRWNLLDERFLDDLHSILKIGVIVVVRSDIGVPREICMQPRLRLCTTHLRDLTVTADAWKGLKGLLFSEALREYAENAHKVPVTTVPFKVALEGHAFRPVPRRGMNANCFYLSEMMQIQYGIGFGVPGASEAEVDVDFVMECMQSYAAYRKIFEASKTVTPEDVLQAASNVREDRNAVVKFCVELKIFRNLKRFPCPVF